MTEAEAPGRLYERVSRDLARRISRGQYPLGARLPAERQLAVVYDVSRPTVREAIIALEVDGLVEVRKGSGVYVISSTRTEGAGTEQDVGPFELLEARRHVEGEVAALAANRIDEAQLRRLGALVDEMQAAGDDVDRAEDADRRFHELIAAASQNSAMVATVASLWDMRARSPQYRLLSDKAHDAGVIPSVSEHRDIVRALSLRRPDDAREAMKRHLGRVLDALLEATEIQEVELARERVHQQLGRWKMT